MRTPIKLQLCNLWFFITRRLHIATFILPNCKKHKPRSEFCLVLSTQERRLWIMSPVWSMYSLVQKLSNTSVKVVYQVAWAEHGLANHDFKWGPKWKVSGYIDVMIRTSRILPPAFIEGHVQERPVLGINLQRKYIKIKYIPLKGLSSLLLKWKTSIYDGWLYSGRASAPCEFFEKNLSIGVPFSLQLMPTMVEEANYLN